MILAPNEVRGQTTLKTDICLYNIIHIAGGTYSGASRPRKGYKPISVRCPQQQFRKSVLLKNFSYKCAFRYTFFQTRLPVSHIFRSLSTLNLVSMLGFEPREAILGGSLASYCHRYHLVLPSGIEPATHPYQGRVLPLKL